MLSQKIKKKKSDFLGYCSYTQLFHDFEKLRREPKIFVKVLQRFWYVQYVGLIFLKINQKQPMLVKFFNVGKIPHTGDKASLDRCG